MKNEKIYFSRINAHKISIKENFRKENNEYTYFKYCFKRKTLIITLVGIIILLIIFHFLTKKINYRNEISDNIISFDNNFDYINYERDLINEKMIKNASWIMELDEAAFINGLIRKHKPKNILEIGVARGGSSILILNAIKDILDSRLVSIDLNSNYKSKKVGYLVNEIFPELMGKWKLYTGDMPHKFLSKLNLNFDFFFLDTAHITPGEFFNLIEVLPFLNENSIVVLHDIVWHLHQIRRIKIKDVKIIPTQIHLMSALIGEKIIIKHHRAHDFLNIGAICLAKNQKKYYLNYFLLLMTLWEYMPTNAQLSSLREFIKKYYNNSLFLRIFDNSIDYNKKFFQNLNNKKYKLN